MCDFPVCEVYQRVKDQVAHGIIIVGCNHINDQLIYNLYNRVKNSVIQYHNLVG